MDNLYESQLVEPKNWNRRGVPFAIRKRMDEIQRAEQGVMFGLGHDVLIGWYIVKKLDDKVILVWKETTTR